MKRAAVGLAGAAMVAAAIVRYPPDPSLRFEPGLMGWPDGGKLAAVLLSLGALAALDLAAYAAGRALHRFLRPAPSPSPGPALAVVERLALGFVLLAYGTLGLAALHALHRGLIAGAVLLLGGAGAVVAIRGLRGRSCSFPLPGLFAAAGVCLLMLSPVLGAWVPDYGWDGFAYHLALPERYLYRNRIVVTPLFPHSAFPQTAEMLYLIALSLDSGALAKLIHLQFGILAAAAIFALAARAASRRAGLLAVAILAADPLFKWELGVAYNDLAATLFAVLAAAAFDEWRTSRSREALRLTAVFAGACMSVRYTAAAVPLAILSLVWLAAPLRAWRPKLAASVTIGGIAALVLSPWLLRNLAFTGNPVAPAAQPLFYAPGEEYFDPVALAQSIEFTRSVGVGRGLMDLALLPVNATLRVREGFYETFGYRMGVMSVVGVLACLLTGAYRAPGAGTALKLAGVLTLLWFYTFQEPRYLLPALCLMAAAGGAGLDRLIPRGRRRWGLLWLVPAAAIVHTQWNAALLMPYRYGYALGRLPVAGFESQEPALAVVPALRRLMGPGDRLLPIYENRGFFYRGLDYVTVNWPELMMMVHESPSPRAFADRLAALGVTHVLVNPNNLSRYRTWFVEGYGPREFEAGLARLDAFIARHTTPVIEDRGVIVRRMKPATGADGS